MIKVEWEVTVNVKLEVEVIDYKPSRKSRADSLDPDEPEEIEYVITSLDYDIVDDLRTDAGFEREVIATYLAELEDEETERKIQEILEK